MRSFMVFLCLFSLKKVKISNGKLWAKQNFEASKTPIHTKANKQILRKASKFIFRLRSCTKSSKVSRKPTWGLYNAPTPMVIRPTNHFLLKQTWASRSIWRNQLEISDFQSLKTPIFHETFASNVSKNFSRGRKKTSKVSRRSAYISAL